MANTNGGYVLTRFAQEGLMYLMLALGMGSRVHRGYSRSATEKGNTIQIPAPGDFEARDAPSDIQDIDARKVSLTLDQWKEVKFALSDKELSDVNDAIIEEHVKPAAYALAKDINEKLTGLRRSIPWAVDWDTDEVLKSVLAARARLAQNGAPITDGDVFAALDSNAEADLLSQPFMHSNNVAGAAGTTPLTDGSLDRRFGVEFFQNYALPDHVSGTIVNGGDQAGALDGAAAKGATQITIDGLTDAQTVKAGDTFVIAGNEQRYAITADAVVAGNEITVPISPQLKQAYADNSVVTFDTATGTNADAYAANMVFHRHAFALGTAPLESDEGSDQARRQGIEVETITDEENGITIRAMMWYDPNSRKNIVALDVLYGVAVLNPDLAVTVRRDA